MNMFNQTLVVIPARGGSKRIRKKNIIPLLGKPMIHWPLEVILEQFKAKQVLLSTDSDEIKKCVRKFSIEINYTRPCHLADDYTTSLDILFDAMDWYRKNVFDVEYVLMVYPTAVLIRMEDINKAFLMMDIANPPDLIFAATEFGFPIQRAILETEHELVKPRENKYYNSRSQDLIKYYHDAGQFYLFKASSINKVMNFSKLKAKIVKLPRNEVIDIDEFSDLKLAEIFLKNRYANA